jgi:hypothetical protein
MKSILLTLTFPLVAMATMTISTNEHVSATLTPDVLQGSLSFEEQNNNGNVIKEDLNAILTRVKKFDPQAKQCQGGGYQITPQYTYTDQKQRFNGYSGFLSFECEFSSIEQYNTLIEAITPVIKKNVHKNEGTLSWGVSEQQRLTTQMALRSALLTTAQLQSDAFSKTTSLACEVSSVNFMGNAMPMARSTMMMKSMEMSDSVVATESPLQHDQKTSLDAMVTYNCSKP